MNLIYNVWLTTRENLKLYQGISSDTDDDTLLDRLIQQASQTIAQYLGVIPLPFIQTRLYDFLPGTITNWDRTLLLDAPLLELTTLTNGDGEAVSSSDYWLLPNNIYPKQAVTLKPSSYAYFQPPCGGDAAQAISVTGIWGYVPHYAHCLLDTGIDVPMGGITASATTLDLGAGESAHFGVGSYVKIDSELVRVTGINSTTDVLTIKRGELGTTAAAHDAGAALLLFQQLADIQDACTEWAAYLYKQKDKIGQQVQVYDNGLQIVNGLSVLVMGALRQHRNIEFGGL
jgi:hypothetical protein